MGCPTCGNDDPGDPSTGYHGADYCSPACEESERTLLDSYSTPERVTAELWRDGHMYTIRVYDLDARDETLVFFKSQILALMRQRFTALVAG